MNQLLEVTWNVFLKAIWSSGIFVMTFLIVGIISSMKFGQVAASLTSLSFFCWMCLSPKFPPLLRDLSIPFFIILGHLGILILYLFLSAVSGIGIGLFTIILALFFWFWICLSYYTAFWKIRWCILETPNKSVQPDK